MTSAGAACQTGGTCAVGERVTGIIRSMREKDGRCVGCGRAYVAEPDVVPAEIADLLTDGPREKILRTVVKRADLEQMATSDDPAAVALRAKPVEEIVDAIISLTHQIHGCIDGKHDERARELRGQRAIAKLEIVRRAS